MVPTRFIVAANPKFSVLRGRGLISAGFCVEFCPEEWEAEEIADYLGAAIQAYASDCSKVYPSLLPSLAPKSSGKSSRAAARVGPLLTPPDGVHGQPRRVESKACTTECRFDFASAFMAAHSKYLSANFLLFPGDQALQNFWAAIKMPFLLTVLFRCTFRDARMKY